VLQAARLKFMVDSPKDEISCEQHTKFIRTERNVLLQQRSDRRRSIIGWVRWGETSIHVFLSYM